jgi:exonuclease III
MRFGTWNIRCLNRSGSNRELARCKLDLAGVQEFRREKEGTVRAGVREFFYCKGNKNHQFGIGVFVHHRIVQTVKRVEFVNDMLSCTAPKWPLM